MAKAFDVNATEEYILESERGVEEGTATVFIIGPLDSRLSAYLSDRAKAFGVKSGAEDDSPATVHMGLEMLAWQTVRFGLRDWRGLKKKDGEDAICKRKMESLPGVGNRLGLSPESLDYIKPYIPELARRLRFISNLSDQDVADFS